MQKENAEPKTTVDPYARDTSFRCDQGHGTWRRDQLPTRRGSLVCPIGLRGGVICGLKMVGDARTRLDEWKAGYLARLDGEDRDPAHGAEWQRGWSDANV